MSENKMHLMRRFIVFSIALFVFILTVGSAVFVFSMQNIIKNNKTNELQQMLELQRIKLENSINSEIAVVLKLADSPIIKRYFADPSDAEIEQYALEELAAYRRAFSSYSVFWVNDVDRIFYSDDNEPYVVFPEEPDNYWYNMTLYETEVYNFNINYNPDLKTAKLWINAPVFDESRKPLGMAGTSIDLSTYVDMIYQSIDDGVELYLFNQLGEITGSKDVETVLAKDKIGDKLYGIGVDVLAEAQSLQPGEAKSFDTASGKVAIGTIPILGWYTVAIAPVGINDYDPMMVALFFVMLAVIALILVIFNVFIAGFIKSLQKTMDSLKVASKAKSEFLATMSHEIRTPLNAIIGVAQIQLQKDGLPAEYADEMERIYASGKNLLGIINDILDMSKIETGNLELNASEYYLPGLINDAVRLNIVRIGARPVEFVLNVGESLPSRLYGDELRLKQILNNLLSNAIKYTEKGRVKLSVLHSAQGEETALRFSVEDTGQGMKPEDLKKLFSEYVRFNKEVNRSTEGTGLGLSITKRLVEMMGGSIEVQSEYGKGSVFTFTVMQKSVSGEPIGAETARKLRSFTFTGERQEDGLQISREPMPYGRVLVVDDMKTNLHVARGLLLQYKLTVEVAESGFAAIEKVEKGKSYDIIFMDHMMPLMDGIETVRKLRAAGYTRSIVALTANALAGNDKMFEQNGFDGFISKPMDIRKLDDILNKFVRDCHPKEADDKAPAAGRGLMDLFCQDAKDAVKTIRESAANGDMERLTIAVRTMKSELAAIGERDASEKAEELESAANSRGGDSVAESAERLAEILEELIKKYASGR